MMKKAFFPGSFDPFTKGHADIVLRILKCADCVDIAIGYNSDKPDSASAAEERTEAINDWIDRNNLSDRVKAYAYSGLTVDAAIANNASFIIRGVRDASDYQYEYNLAVVNRKLSGLETLILPTDPSLCFVSSSIVRELKSYGRDISEFIP